MRAGRGLAWSETLRMCCQGTPWLGQAAPCARPHVDAASWALWSVKASGPLSSVEAPNSHSSLTRCMSLDVEITMGLAIFSAVASPQILFCLSVELSSWAPQGLVDACSVFVQGDLVLVLTVCAEGVKKSLHFAPAIFDKILPHCLLMPVSFTVAENQNNQDTCLLTFCITKLLNCSENRFSSCVLLAISDGL